MVHQYQLNGYNIVLDTCSGSVHVVDEVAYDVIAMYPDHTADEIVAAMMAKYGDREDVTEADLRQCIDDVASLKESGKLWSPDTYENLAFDFKNRNTVVKALCLHVAHTCNLNCSYCFASQGRYQGERALMSFEVGKRAMDFLIDTDQAFQQPIHDFLVFRRLNCHAPAHSFDRLAHPRFDSFDAGGSSPGKLPGFCFQLLLENLPGDHITVTDYCPKNQDGSQQHRNG